MKTIFDYELKPAEAGLWFLGQAGYVAKAGGRTLAIDPYLTDAAGHGDPGTTRRFPAPIAPEDLKVDIYLVTHDHTDHLDPETIGGYRHKEDTIFVAPRLACRKLAKLGVPEGNIRRVDSGETEVVEGVTITGVYAIPNEPGAVDTSGYFVQFANGRSFYHTADTDFSEVLLMAAPKGCEVLLTCINGKWGNLNVHQAARLTAKVRPRFAIPNHYDVMAANSENPAAFIFFLKREAPDIAVKVLEVMEPFVWDGG